MRVHKFLSLKFGLKTLREKHLKISTVDDLNDPFELLAYEMTVRKKRKEWRSARKVWGSQHGVLCFSADWKDPVIWAHYSDKHKGLCLGFEIPEGAGREVQYVNERLELADTLRIEDANAWLYTKYGGRVSSSLKKHQVNSGIQTQKVARAIALGIGLLIVVSLFALFVVLMREGFNDASNGVPFRHWLYLATSALALLGSIALGYGIYATWRTRWSKTEAHHVIPGQLERRGSPALGVLRDDDFERHLNWLREHKQLVKAIEGIAIAVLALIALLFGISER